MARGTKYPREVRDRGTQWAAIKSVSGKLGMSPETLRKWVRQAEIDGGTREGITTAETQRVRDLEDEVRELRRANEILKSASIFFARELDPRPPRR